MEHNFIDDLARKALQNMEVPYQSEDWALMEARLDQEQTLRGQLFFFKAVEVMLVLLALWTLFQFLPATESVNSTPGNSHEPGLIIPADKVHDHPSIKAIDADHLTPDEKSTPLNQQITPAKPTADARTNSAKPPAFNKQDQGTVARLDKKPADPLPPDGMSEGQSKTNFLNQNNTSYSETLTLENLNETSEAATSRNALSTIMLPSKNPVTFNNQPYQWAFFPIGGDPLPERIIRPKRIGLIFSPDMNAMANNLSMGFSAGAMLATELHDNWDLETGLIYSYKPFDYLATDATGKPIDERAIQDVVLHIAEIPVMAQYSFNKSVNWRSYATFGTSAFFIAHADYNKGNIELPIDVSDNSEKGLLQGGRFTSNFYLTANIGFGLSRKLSKNTSLFVQPTFRYPLMSMGPYEDKLGTFSLAMGVRAML